MNNRGIEGLPLKYLVIALVASIVIALALQMTSIIQSSVVKSTDLVADSLTGRIVESALGEKYTVGFDRVSVFNWFVNSSNPYNEVSLSLVNSGSGEVNITSVKVSFSGSSDNQVFSNGLLLFSGESTSQMQFNIPSVNKGDKVSISVLVSFNSGSPDSGSLVGFAQ